MLMQLGRWALLGTAWARTKARGSLRIGVVGVPIFVAVVWHAAFKINDVAGRGLFTMVAIEQGHQSRGSVHSSSSFPLSRRRTM
jgi:hypothetical protein